MESNKLERYRSGMQFSQQSNTNDFRIHSYDEGVITIGASDYQNSLILMPDRIIEDWRPNAIDDLRSDDLKVLIEYSPEIVLIGTGIQLRFPAPDVTVDLLQAGIGVEVMDTAAASRTFNVLLSENRKVVAALLLQ